MLVQRFQRKLGVVLLNLFRYRIRTMGLVMKVSKPVVLNLACFMYSFVRVSKIF